MADITAAERAELDRRKRVIAGAGAGYSGAQVPPLVPGFLNRPAGAVGANPLLSAEQTPDWLQQRKDAILAANGGQPPEPQGASLQRTQANPLLVSAQPPFIRGGAPTAPAATSALIAAAAPPGLFPGGSQFSSNPSGVVGRPGSGINSGGVGYGGTVTGYVSPLSGIDRERRINAVLAAGQPAQQPRPQRSAAEIAKAQGGLYSTDRTKQIQSRAVLSDAGQTNLPAIAGNGVGTPLTTPDYNRFKAQTELARMNRGQPAAQAAVNSQTGVDAVLRRTRLTGVNPQDVAANGTMLAQMNGAAGGGNAPGGVPLAIWRSNPQAAQAMANANLQGQKLGQMSPDQMAQLYMARMADLQKNGITGPAAHRQVQQEMAGMNAAIGGGNRLLGSGGGQIPPLGGGGSVVQVNNPGAQALVDPDSLQNGPDKERAKMLRESAVGDMSDRVLADLDKIYGKTKRLGKFDLHAPGFFTTNTPENYKRFHENAIAAGHGEKAIKNHWLSIHNAEPSETTH